MKIQAAYYKYSSAETAKRADSGQLQFWSEPSEILNLRSLSTPEPVAFIPNLVKPLIYTSFS